ncbi:hypothetical protein F3Y22_tig00110847pilonHSYRG00263 [Hibiscus syriacus]|uniref:Tf2-1-like SH3-like domain-containing protein n=1 Tax=Hibiscus syriacus TaxID=106335 RepID=A0A6A2ZN12_HIBSY|nr:hypothetical protein F3Y22_tig00110847pilonHSYRG00263 [Hibiscus syriacus]
MEGAEITASRNENEYLGGVGNVEAVTKDNREIHRRDKCMSRSTADLYSSLCEGAEEMERLHSENPSGSDGSVDIESTRGKSKIRAESEDIFPFSPKPVQVELPLFNGKDLEEWLAYANDFFEFYGNEDHHRSARFDDDSEKSNHQKGNCPSWFKSRQWKIIKHALKIWLCAQPTSRMSSLYNVLSGLRPDIKIEVLGHRSNSMSEVLALARFHEAKFNETRKVMSRMPSMKLPPLLHTTTTCPAMSKAQTSRPLPSKHYTVSSTPMQPRRISVTEAQSRREKGLCYYCDAKFVSDHKCKDHQLFLLDDELEDKQPVQTTVVMTNESNELESSDDTTRDQSLVSFNALAGCLTPNTLRFMGEVHGRQVRILIDGGSTHNFVQSQVAKYLGLPVMTASNFRGTEMVLAIAWIATLGLVIMDFGTLSFQFRQGDKEHRWQGDTSDVQLATQNTFNTEDMEKQLSEFEKVFVAPHGLSPMREIDHAIHLQPMSKRVNVRPYKCPYFQKEEVECQVQDMLENQLIRKIKDKFTILTADELFDELGDDPSKWEKYLAWAEYWYNTAYQTSAGMTPFQALYGREPPTIVHYLEGSSPNAQKLGPRFFGPYRVTKRIGPVSYKLELPESSRIHPIFHVSQLKPCKGQPLQKITHLPLIIEDFVPPAPTENLEDKVILSGGGIVMEGAEITTSRNENEYLGGDGNAEAVTKDNPKIHRSLRERNAPHALIDFVRY